LITEVIKEKIASWSGSRLENIHDDKKVLDCFEVDDPRIAYLVQSIEQALDLQQFPPEFFSFSTTVAETVKEAKRLAPTSVA
jgi:hypothetical protein